jgi:hypothetical protein
MFRHRRGQGWTASCGEVELRDGNCVGRSYRDMRLCIPGNDGECLNWRKGLILEDKIPKI